MMKTIDRETFARWSYEQDQKVGASEGRLTWSVLSASRRELAVAEVDIYLQEADFYLSGKSKLGWPNDIVERANAEGYEVPTVEGIIK